MRTAFTVNTTVTYFPARIPMFRRIPRAMKATFTMTSEIPCVSGDEAPVAAVFPEQNRPSDIAFPEAGLRFFEGGLYTLDGRGAPGGLDFPSRQRECIGDGHRETVERVVSDKHGSLLIVDGQIWMKVEAPFYRLEAPPEGVTLTTGFFRHSGWPGLKYFAAVDRDAAVQAGEDLAVAEGHPSSLPAIREFQGVSILIPEAFRTAQ